MINGANLNGRIKCSVLMFSYFTSFMKAISFWSFLLVSPYTLVSGDLKVTGEMCSWQLSSAHNLRLRFLGVPSSSPVSEFGKSHSVWWHKCMMCLLFGFLFACSLYPKVGCCFVFVKKKINCISLVNLNVRVIIDLQLKCEKEPWDWHLLHYICLSVCVYPETCLAPL